MKIERIDDKTVKCFLSNEELEEYDIDYKDFVTRSDKAKEVVQEIIEQAADVDLRANDIIYEVDGCRHFLPHLPYSRRASLPFR